MKQSELFAGLKESTIQWLKDVLKLGKYDASEMELLRRVAELREIADITMEQLQTDNNFTYTDRFGQPHSHPRVRTYQQSVDLQARLLKQLNIRNIPNEKEEKPADPLDRFEMINV